jgi:flagellar motor component MotA
MRKELGLLNLICILVAVAFLALAVISALGAGAFLTIDNLFIITVSLVMALVFGVIPLHYLKSEGKLPLPFVKRTPAQPRDCGERSTVRHNCPPARRRYSTRKAAQFRRT